MQQVEAPSLRSKLHCRKICLWHRIHRQVRQRAMRTRQEATAAGSPSQPERVVICGAGIIGSATAYYLSQYGIQPVLVERGGVACASSGKAGGFLALEWQDGQPTGPLSRRSYELHAELAKRLGTNVGYRQVSTLSLSVSSNGKASGKPRRSLPQWLDGNISGARPAHRMAARRNAPAVQQQSCCLQQPALCSFVDHPPVVQCLLMQRSCLLGTYKSELELCHTSLY